MHDHTATENRHQRRAAASARLRARGRTAVARPALPLDAAALAEVGAEANRRAKAAVLASLGVDVEARGEAPDGLLVVDNSGPEPDAHTLAELAGPLIAFAARQVLAERGVAATVVAGAAAWSVGPDAGDVIDCGITAGAAWTRGPRALVREGHVHTWLTVEGHIVDFAARHLRPVFEAAHRQGVLSTPPARWRAIPDAIVHRAGVPMPDPRRDRRAAYMYRDGGPMLPLEFVRALGHVIRHMEPDPATGSGLFVPADPGSPDPLGELIDHLRQRSDAERWHGWWAEEGFHIGGQAPAEFVVHRHPPVSEGDFGEGEYFILKGPADLLVFTERRGRIVYDERLTYIIQNLPDAESRSAA